MSQDPHAGRFLDSSDKTERPFRALGSPGSEVYVGLETFPNPGCHSVTYASDEIVAYCPITKQPDFYAMEMTLLGTEKCIESKSLKLWLRQFNNDENGLFCEALAVFIRDEVGAILGYTDGEGNYDEEEISNHVQVILTQKSRGGISIRSIA